MELAIGLHMHIQKGKLRLNFGLIRITVDSSGNSPLFTLSSKLYLTGPNVDCLKPSLPVRSANSMLNVHLEVRVFEREV
jgi:hypothetical protein